MGYGGEISSLLDLTLKEGNYCTVEEFSSYLNTDQMEKWYLLLHNKAYPSEFLQFKKEFKNKCNGGVDKSFKEITFQAFASRHLYYTNNKRLNHVTRLNIGIYI